ncbi:D-alanyl-D-alanine carboxypeptidase [Clostridium sp. MSJ-11]|uniref:D-alanyl-D-alanine carboxypeptidase n=1 Tax=Clostridium mobile TaxID=2841512 RepID=A0ABS6EJL5_9CLOT|nr:D-alanyl-D-alanine carboxypeptidase family protein [Clostridium mobile]MBU5484871.1 D-alanyl-D-alanine carboxypeptidase [Clostridium mobile]
MKKRCTSLLLTIVLIFSFCTSAFAAESKPDIYGKAGITIDMKTGEIIYAKSVDSKMYPASTTKLLTALLLAEKFDKGDALKYTESAKSQPEYSLNLNLHPIDIGETMTAEDVMDGLLLFSGNDIAYMIADNVSGSSEKFTEDMNNKIKSLGLKNTHFITPNGLHDPEHYTTAYDLTVIGREAYKNSWVKESMNKETSTIKTSKGTTFIIENRNKLVGKDGNVGGKTGYTSKAGRCLVAMYERDGRQILGVVLNSVYDSQDSFVFEDMKEIIDWSFNAKKISLHQKDTPIKTEKLSYKPLVFFGPVKEIEVPLILKEDVLYYDNEVNKKEAKEEIKLDTVNPWKIDENTSIGTLSLKEREAVKEYKLYTTISKGEIIKSNLILYIGTFIGLIIVILLIMSIIKTITRRKRRRRKSKYL